ncbi:MAG TPA: phage tail tube protein [Alphaproteobacteria bacterium]|nr:phage tail tube protein [Alphaproteobacteria bacterium]
MTAQIGHGIAIERGDSASPETWTSIGNITDPDYPTLSRDAVETTHTQSTSKYREFIGGLRDGGEVAPTIELDPGDTTYSSLVSDFESDSAVHYRVKSPDEGEAWDFMGLITNMEHDVSIDDENTVTVTFKITGQPSLETLS